MYVNFELDLQFHPSIPPCTALAELEHFQKFLTPSIVVEIFGSTNYLVKFKVRLCAGGDLQATELDTSTASLAARTFRALMAIAAAVDLEVRQYDAVNAFANGSLNEIIYFHFPESPWRCRGFDRRVAEKSFGKFFSSFIMGLRHVDEENVGLSD